MSSTTSAALATFNSSMAAFATQIKSMLVSDIQMGVPYPTGKTLDGKRIMAVRVDCGTLPHTTSKLIAMPTAATSTMINKASVWIDPSNSYASWAANNENFPLPRIDHVGSKSVMVDIKSDDIRITTATDMGFYTSIVTVNWVENT